MHSKKAEKTSKSLVQKAAIVSGIVGLIVLLLTPFLDKKGIDYPNLVISKFINLPIGWGLLIIALVLLLFEKLPTILQAIKAYRKK